MRCLNDCPYTWRCTALVFFSIKRSLVNQSQKIDNDRFGIEQEYTLFAEGRPLGWPQSFARSLAGPNSAMGCDSPPPFASYVSAIPRLKALTTAPPALTSPLAATSSTHICARVSSPEFKSRAQTERCHMARVPSDPRRSCPANGNSKLGRPLGLRLPTS